MKKQTAPGKRPNIRITVADSTWQVLAHLARAPRELLIHLSQTSPDHVRGLSNADTKKLLTKISPTEIAQLIIRAYIQNCAPLTKHEIASLAQPGKEDHGPRP